MDGHSAVQIVDCIGVIKSRIGAKVPTDEDGGGRGPKSRFGIAKRPQIEREEGRSDDEDVRPSAVEAM